jgi:RimJ/RimL family protein N-acetyltransferase
MPQSTTKLKLQPATTADIPTIADLAHRIWNACYPGIITQAQIDYMLARMYAAETMQSEMENHAATYYLAEHHNQPIGFFCLKPGTTPHIRFLDKCYLLPEWHGYGFAQQMLAFAANEARQHACSCLQLRCNIANLKAIAAYKRFGMRETDRICSDIGGGFKMDDVILSFHFDTPPAFC